MEIKTVGQGGQTSLENDYTPNVRTSSTDDKTKSEDKKVSSKVGSKDVKEIKKAVDKLNGFLNVDKTHAEFAVHDKFSNDIMVKIIDDSTGNVITEVPPKKILDMVAKMCEMVGIIFDHKA